MPQSTNNETMEELRQDANEELNTTETSAVEQEETSEQAEEQTSTQEQEEEGPKEPTVEEKLEAALNRIKELETERLYKQAEFDNYRKNVLKEKTELILNGGRKVLESMLPVMDDFDRALQHMESAEDVASVKEGVDLIQKKFAKVLKSHGVTQMETKDADFNVDFHEAIAQFPAPSDDAKGKIIDCTEKGYMLNDTVLRFAKVVVGI